MLRVLLIGGCLLLPAVSLAANAPKTQEIVIDEDGVIKGRLEAPNFGDVKTRKPGEFQSIIPVRKDFAEKVVASVSDL